mmetsp:Transcript_129068/g.413580  ORF Transcript_129068/g.413580 Transcript_129068/m.413580 type:complete len:115 (+) Transcript_129068:63-407(+)
MAAAAVAPPMPALAPRAQWQFSVENSDWQPFTISGSEVLEAAYVQFQTGGLPSTTVRSGKFEYTGLCRDGTDELSLWYISPRAPRGVLRRGGGGRTPGGTRSFAFGARLSGRGA